MLAAIRYQHSVSAVFGGVILYNEKDLGSFCSRITKTSLNDLVPQSKSAFRVPDRRSAVHPCRGEFRLRHVRIVDGAPACPRRVFQARSGPADVDRCVRVGTVVGPDVGAGGVWAQHMSDFGCAPEIINLNFHILDIDPTKIEGLILSHAHRDHFGGLSGGKPTRLNGSIKAENAQFVHWRYGLESGYHRVLVHMAATGCLPNCDEKRENRPTEKGVGRGRLRFVSEQSHRKG